MPGNLEGGKKAAQTNKEYYGEDFYSRIGRIGGQNGRSGGFGSNVVGSDGLTGKQRARVVGALGGRKSKRLPKGNDDIHL